MGQRRTDAKDLSPGPVAIGNGELELKRKSEEDADSNRRLEAGKDTNHKSRHKRSKSRSRSRSRDDLPEESERRHKKVKSRRNHVDEALSKDANAGNTSAPPGETEEEYDARLEREENERLATERRRHLERFKQLDDTAPKDGIRFKGRGRMKFIDPEISQRQS